jgi:hypothetical protein
MFGNVTSSPTEECDVDQDEAIQAGPGNRRSLSYAP